MINRTLAEVFCKQDVGIQYHCQQQNNFDMHEYNIMSPLKSKVAYWYILYINEDRQLTIIERKVNTIVCVIMSSTEIVCQFWTGTSFIYIICGLKCIVGFYNIVIWKSIGKDDEHWELWYQGKCCRRELISCFEKK